MERRDFLKLASMAGLGVVAAGPLAGSAKAAEPYTGPLWIFVHAGGGWDPTSFCDPKGWTTTENDPERMNNYPASGILSAGNIRYAPVAANAAFFGAHYNQLLVINGIDTGTNSHDAGTRATWCGTLTEGRPALAALLAGVNGPTQPMAYISNGGYDFTASVVPVTRVPDTGTLARIAYPNRFYGDDENSPLYHTEGTIGKIATAREARHQARLAQQRLPALRQNMSTLYTSRLGQNELKQLIQYLPTDFSQNGLARQGQVAIAAYRAGICISANLETGGFDTHGDHDNQHFGSLTNLFDGVTEIVNFAQAAGVLDRTYIIMGSDFGRTPGYNEGNGKDHWNITSMMMMGPGITGNRVIGVTDERHGPISVDPVTLQESGGGIRITPAHIHKALRKLAGIDTSPVLQPFALTEAEEDLPLFG
jgi:hypothetical protein